MAIRLNPEWMRQREAEANQWLMDKTEKIEHITGEPTVAKFLVGLLARKGIPFQVIQLGAGVKKITTDTEVCSKCGGTGRC